MQTVPRIKKRSTGVTFVMLGVVGAKKGARTNGLAAAEMNNAEEMTSTEAGSVVSLCDCDGAARMASKERGAFGEGESCVQ